MQWQLWCTACTDNNIWMTWANATSLGVQQRIMEMAWNFSAYEMTGNFSVCGKWQGMSQCLGNDREFLSAWEMTWNFSVPGEYLLWSVCVCVCVFVCRGPYVRPREFSSSSSDVSQFRWLSNDNALHSAKRLSVRPSQILNNTTMSAGILNNLVTISTSVKNRGIMLE